MKKLSLIFLLSIFLIFLVAGCKDSEQNEKDRLETKSDIVVVDKGVILKVKEGSITNNLATLILENNSNLTVGYGKDYFLQKEVNGEWYNLEVVSYRVFETPLFSLKSGDKVEIERVGLNYGYGDLSRGKYRIVKGVSFIYEDKMEDFFVAAEFIIE